MCRKAINQSIGYHQSKIDIQNRHSGIQDQMDTSTIIFIGYDRRLQAALETSILIPFAA